MIWSWEFSKIVVSTLYVYNNNIHKGYTYISTRAYIKIILLGIIMWAASDE